MTDEAKIIRNRIILLVLVVALVVLWATGVDARPDW